MILMEDMIQGRRYNTKREFTVRYSYIPTIKKKKRKKSFDLNWQASNSA